MLLRLGFVKWLKKVFKPRSNRCKANTNKVGEKRPDVQRMFIDISDPTLTIQYENW